MRRFLGSAVIILAVMAMSGCQKDNTAVQGAKHATVTMKDGTTTAGNVTSTSDKEIVVQGDDKITRTIPMDQVKSIEYNDVAPAAGQLPAGNEAPAERDAQAPTRAAQELRPTYELPVGTKVSVRTFEMIDSATAAEGQTFDSEVTKDVHDSAGDLVIPARSKAQIIIKSASKGGTFRGASDLVLDMQSVTIGGKRYGIDTTAISKVGKQGIGANKRTATYTGGGAALGAIIGAIAGGGKGAAIGAASGAGAGAVTQTVTKGGSIKVPAETVLTFQLDKPLTVSAE